MQGYFGAGGLTQLFSAAGVVEVVVGEEDVLDPHFRVFGEELEPRLEGLVVAEAAVDEGAFAALVHEEDVWRLRARVEGRLGGDGVDVVS